ncbi:hypothetical protein ACFE04_021249 [Oxalis oulophora]
MTTDDTEVLRFLMLVAAYGLANAYDDDKVSNYSVVVAQHSLASKLLHALEFGDKISVTTKNKAREKRIIDLKTVHKFIKNYKLEPEFPDADVKQLTVLINSLENGIANSYKISATPFGPKSHAAINEKITPATPGPIRTPHKAEVLT